MDDLSRVVDEENFSFSVSSDPFGDLGSRNQVKLVVVFRQIGTVVQAEGPHHYNTANSNIRLVRGETCTSGAGIAGSPEVTCHPNDEVNLSVDISFDQRAFGPLNNQVAKEIAKVVIEQPLQLAYTSKSLDPETLINGLTQGCRIK